MKMICRIFAVAFAVTAIFSVTAKEIFYKLYFDDGSFVCGLNTAEVYMCNRC